MWIAATGLAVVVAVVGWRGTRWWRRGMSVLAIPLCGLATALMLNLWVGYFPTVQTAWNQVTAGPLPDQTDRATVTAMVQQHAIPAKGTVVKVTIPSDASHFAHRDELVYLPPAYYATNPPPKLPTVMMIGGEFNTPLTGYARATRSRRSTTSLPHITATLRCSCSSTPAGPSTTTPNASTARGAMRPTI